MALLRHPLYSALALGMCLWLSKANSQGLSFLYSANPVHWPMFAGTGGSGSSHSGGHGISHFSHK